MPKWIVFGLRKRKEFLEQMRFMGVKLWNRSCFRNTHYITSGLHSSPFPYSGSASTRRERESVREREGWLPLYEGEPQDRERSFALLSSPFFFAFEDLESSICKGQFLFFGWVSQMKLRLPFCLGVESISISMLTQLKFPGFSYFFSSKCMFSPSKFMFRWILQEMQQS